MIEDISYAVYVHCKLIDECFFIDGYVFFSRPHSELHFKVDQIALKVHLNVIRLAGRGPI